MLYRKFGKTNEMVSSLAFGCMRLPVLNDDTKQIDDEKAIVMVRTAIDGGVNYLDTAYPYHGGASEPFVKRVIADGYREKVKIATKLPCWLVKTREDMDKYLNEQLDNIGIKQIDFYLLHALSEERWNKMRDLGAVDFMNKAKADGRIKHAGFSYHDKPEKFIPIVDGYDWDFVQIQYNYIDEENQAGLAGLNYAADKNMGIAIMEPLRGGNLVKSIPTEVTEILDTNEVKYTPVEWALKWLYDQEKVHVVLSGMSAMEHVVENVRIASESGVGSMTEAEHILMNKAKKAFNDRISVHCTACEYCLPCPLGVNIPGNFALFNTAKMFEGKEVTLSAKRQYDNMSESEKASACIECGECVPKCPQQIDIPTRLKEVVELFEK